MRHKFNIVPEHIIIEDRAKRRQELRLLRNPDCRDPSHPGCDKCEPSEAMPEGHMTVEAWAEKFKSEIDKFVAANPQIEHDEEPALYSALWDWLCTLGNDDE